MTSTDILKRARKRLADSGRYLQHKFAVDAAGGQVLADSPDAVAWCSLGAMQAEYWPECCEVAALNSVLRMSRSVGSSSITTWHDECGSLDKVLAGFDKAIEGAGRHE